MVRSRWSTPFGGWVHSYGVSRLVDALAHAGQPVTRKAVYSWVSGRAVPRLPHVAVIMQASEGRIGVHEILEVRSADDAR